MKIRKVLFACMAVAACLSLRAGTLYWCVDSTGDDTSKFMTVCKELQTKGTLSIGLYQGNSLLEKIGLEVSADGNIVSSGLFAIASSVEADTAFRWEIMAEATSAMPEDLPVVEMNLNRPFAFAITGADGLPLFVGAVNTME